MPRSSVSGLCTITSATCSTMKPISDQAMMKWIERAVWRPPNIMLGKCSAASVPGDMASPVTIISGSITKITAI